MLLRRLIICGALLGAIIGSGSSSGAILTGDADGWHTWQLDGPGTIKVFVHMVAGYPEDILVLSAECPVYPESAIVDHGLVSAADNVGWFRSIIENRRLGKDIREMALFALVQSNSAEAYVYLDTLLSRG